MKEAMKSKDSVKLGTVRSVISAIKNQEIDSKKEATEEDILALVTKEVKKRKELQKKRKKPKKKNNKLKKRNK